ncbi:MAG: HlyD family efflux transporter periplasmic adaptor subunit [Bacteroidota bacterium]
MDRPIDKKEVRQRKLRFWVRILATLALIALAVWGFRYLISPKAEASQMRVAVAEIGTVSNSVTASGLVVPAFEEQLNAPIGSEIERIVLRAGTEVQRGDLILELDREFVGLQLDGLRDQLAVRQNNIALLDLEYDRDIQELAYDTEILSLRLAAAEAQLADSRRLLEIGGATQEEVEAAELTVRISQLERDKLQNELDYRRESLDGRKRELQLEVEIQEKEVRQLARRLDELAVLAPRPGVITWVNESVGQRVEAGAPLVRLADLSQYRVEGTCSDRFSEQVRLGYAVSMRIQQQEIAGTVSAILPAVENNTIRFIVDLENPSHNLLRPNLRTELRVISAQHEDVVRVKNGPAFRGGTSQDIFVLDGNEAVKRRINLGFRSGDFIEVTSGLEPGERVIISDLERYRDLERFTLND